MKLLPVASEVIFAYTLHYRNAIEIPDL
jgi:hypothetical protein